MKHRIPVFLVLALILSSCDSHEPAAPAVAPDSDRAALSASKAGDDPSAFLASVMDAVNAGLAEEGEAYRAAMAEWISGPARGEAGNTVFAKDVGNKQLAFDFVPNDGRRPWSGPPNGPTDNVTYAIDQTGDAVPPFGGLDADQTTAAIQRAMSTWDNVQCSDLALMQNPDFGIDIGVVAFIFSGGLVGSPFIFADVQHAGFRDLNFAGNILGVAFTFGFVDGGGNFTDVDSNGKLDAAFREIYYDPSFSWADDGSTNVDVETVALHEAGHGLSQAHFGKVWLDNKGNLKLSPAAVMNAAYTGPRRALKGTDNGGHCSNWSQWPNN